jgi:threonyl-tRNA synthetase
MRTSFVDKIRCDCDRVFMCDRVQIPAEIEAAIQFMEATYGIFKFDFDLALSTRPDNYMGVLVL